MVSSHPVRASAVLELCLVLYVIILSAALDLVPPSTPKGIIAFCNIFPALVAKLGWPYLLKGRIRYARRLVGCTVIGVGGMMVSVRVSARRILSSGRRTWQVVALFDTLYMRLLGICLASFSSGKVFCPKKLACRRADLYTKVSESSHSSNYLHGTIRPP